MRDEPYDYMADPGVQIPTSDDLVLAYRNLADWLTAYTGERVRTALALERDRIDSELSELRDDLATTRRMMLRLAKDQLEINRTIGAILSPGLHSVAADSPLREE